MARRSRRAPDRGQMSAPQTQGAGAPAARVSSWHRPPRQARSRETLERLLDAGEMLLTDRGFEGMRLRDVAEAAGLSVGAIYQRFPDKESFYTALQQNFANRIRDEMAPRFAPEVWEGRDAHAVVSKLVELVVFTFREHRGPLRAFLRRRSNAPELEPPMRLFGAQITRVLTALLRDRPGIAFTESTEERVAIGMQVVFSAAVHAVLNSPEPLEIDDARMAPHLIEMLTGYLGIDDPKAPSTRRGSKGDR